MPKPDGEKVRPVVLVICDGWGSAPAGLQGNAVLMADTPNVMNLWENYPHTELFAHGQHVGLPAKQPGNSEAGHMNLGAGRIVKQDSVYITESIEDGTFFRNTAFLETLKHVEKYGTDMHLMGMLSNGRSAHASPDHLYALLDLCRRHRIKNVWLHLFTDGRDGPRFEAPAELHELLARTRANERVATIMGRFYSMDRGKTWERVSLAYHCIVNGEGLTAPDAESGLLQAYNRGETDEFVIPTVVVDKDNVPIARVKDNDGVIFFNLRSDRARELAKAFLQNDFEKENPHAFKRRRVAHNIRFTAMTDFGPDLPHILTAFPAREVHKALTEVIDGRKQLYIAESEKFAHITYFFNGGVASPRYGEERIRIPSLKIPRYDMAPEMRAREITDTVISKLDQGDYQFVAINYANADMVSHTGNLYASITAVEILDECVGKLWKAIQKHDGYLIFTADHGNVEEMIDVATGGVNTEHSTYPVPFIAAGPDLKGFRELPRGVLGDVAPTILKLMGIRQPDEMTGRSLLSE